MADTTLDCTPLAEPVNAFGYMAERLRTERYPTAEGAAQGAQLAQWFAYMAQHVTGEEAESTEPVILTVLARVAMDGAERARFAAIAPLIDAAIQKAKEAPGAAPDNGGGAGGFVIDADTGEVVESR